MKTTTALPAPALSYKPRVKKHLIKVIIYLTSEKFLTFASVIGCLWSWWGVCSDDNNATAYGTLVFLAGFTPWAWRQTAHDLRQDRLGLKEW